MNRTYLKKVAVIYIFLKEGERGEGARWIDGHPARTHAHTHTPALVLAGCFALCFSSSTRHPAGPYLTESRSDARSFPAMVAVGELLESHKCANTAPAQLHWK